MNLLLENMKGCSDRSARFVTVIALLIGEEEFTFEGRVEGMILTERHGEAGFGYDPIFQPVEADCSFACMSPEAKNAISHRGRATQKLIEKLKTIDI